MDRGYGWLLKGRRHGLFAGCRALQGDISATDSSLYAILGLDPRIQGHAHCRSPGARILGSSPRMTEKEGGPGLRSVEVWDHERKRWSAPGDTQTVRVICRPTWPLPRHKHIRTACLTDTDSRATGPRHEKSPVIADRAFGVRCRWKQLTRLLPACRLPRRSCRAWGPWRG